MISYTPVWESSFSALGAPDSIIPTIMQQGDKSQRSGRAPHSMHIENMQ